MSESNSSSSSGIGVFGLLGVAFVVLKLCGVIGWSWWWVTAPFWGGFILAILFLCGYVGIALAVTVWREGQAKRARAARVKSMKP